MGKTTFTISHPIPSFIPTSIALSALHDHSNIITCNSLVLSFRPIAPPPEASGNELTTSAGSSWYEITERIQYVKGLDKIGLGKLGSGKISFNGWLCNEEWGLATHVLAPMGVELRVRYNVVDAEEGSGSGLHNVGDGLLALGSEGLCLRAEVEVRTNGLLVGFVRKSLKEAVEEMVGKIVKIAERMDAEQLRVMIQGERIQRNATIKARHGSSMQMVTAWV